MLESLDRYDGSDTDRAGILRAFDQQLAVLHGGSKSDTGQVAKAEAAVSQDPERAFQFDDQGFARLEAGGYSWNAGRFSCPSLGALSSLAKPTAKSKLRLWVLEGSSQVTDIGALQAYAPEDSLFQVASQFNCLESPGPYLSKVRDYFSDPTQGPRASISAYPGTLLRHYAAPSPEGGRFTQLQGGPQINLLGQVAWNSVASVRSGYLRAKEIHDANTFGSLLVDHFDDIQVGLQERVQVVLGANWDGAVTGTRHVHQVLTSTLAAGGYGRVDFSQTPWMLICRQLQRAAYLGTLLAAATTGQRRAVLTLIGGGVFGNPVAVIWDSILWACRKVGPYLGKDLTVVVNGRELSHAMELGPVRKAARSHGGDLLFCRSGGASF